MHWLLTDEGCEPFLLDELRRNWPGAKNDTPAAGWVTTAAPLTESAAGHSPLLAFCRQALPDAIEQQAPSINQWAGLLAESIRGAIPADQPWRLHLWPAYGEGRAGMNRCELIRQALADRLRKQARHCLRALEEGAAPFAPLTSLVQLVLRSPEHGLLSITPAPLPWQCRGIVSAFPAGDVPVAVDKAAPSRAFAKLIEAEQRLGLAIQKNDTCIDLGASPGSWSYVALGRGARVVAVDRTELRDDLMRHPLLEFHRGDAFKFAPAAQADWLLCDVIAAPRRSIDLLLEWLRARRMRRFIVTIKFIGSADYALLDDLKTQVPPLCAEFHLTRLSANKNEACAFGVTAP